MNEAYGFYRKKGYDELAMSVALKNPVDRIVLLQTDLVLHSNHPGRFASPIPLSHSRIIGAERRRSRHGRQSRRVFHSLSATKRAVRACEMRRYRHNADRFRFFQGRIGEGVRL